MTESRDVDDVVTGNRDADDLDADEPVDDETLGDPESRLYPLSPKTTTTLFYLGLFLWAGVMLWIALDWNWQDKLFPLVFSTLALLLIAVHLLVQYAGDRLQQLLPNTSQTGSDELSFEGVGDMGARTGRLRERYELVMIVWVITLPIALYVIGFLYTIPLYTVGFIWYFNRDMRTALLAALVASVMVYGLFVEILGIRLPGGLLFG